MRKRKLTLPAARRELKRLQAEIETLRLCRANDNAFWARQKADLEAKLADKHDHLLEPKQALLKELSFLVNATSRAVRTTMWSLAPEKRRGW